MLSADQLTYLIPHDSFVDEAGERTFIAALVEKLTPVARERSKEAVAFAAG